MLRRCSTPRAGLASVPVQLESLELHGLHRTHSLWMGTRTSGIDAKRAF